MIIALGGKGELTKYKITGDNKISLKVMDTIKPDTASGISCYEIHTDRIIIG